ncbi:Sorting nexin-13 [Pseudolycoriella hygida]|uniref:Sorting nexin-13 n=1 Tax=Pseudolycoriella hygida TaxID=35572 RepID=A0A9Q0RV98_9DIPT|nr:Sorting nexin-13 [Pseudolycoriella hygida]
MELKYISYSGVVLCLLINIFGLFWFCVIVLSLIGFLLGIVSIVYLQHGSDTDFLHQAAQRNPLDDIKTLGLNLGYDKKTVVLINPNIKIQTESLSNKKSQDNRKKSLIDSGLDLLFKKHSKNVKDGLSPSTATHSHSSKPLASNELKFQQDVVLDSKEQPHHLEKRWKPFDSIKIYKEKVKGHEDHHKGGISIGEDCVYPVVSVPTIVVKQPQFNDSNLLDEHGSPKRKAKVMLSGNKPVDQLLHSIIDNILRDYIDSWFLSLSDNKEFSEFRTRNCIEESVQNICQRIKSVQWVPLITTKLVENLATHSRLYRLASQAVTNSETKDNKSNHSPQRRTTKKEQHRRNKSDTDLNWYMSKSMHKNVANSKFYTDHVDEKSLVDPEVKLLHSFFSICDTYRDECMDDETLEKYLTQITETILYFTLPNADFACLPLRTFLSTLLANVVLKPLLEMLSDPDMINLSIARLCPKEPPVEFLLKLLRCSTDLSELRACRQFITKEMDSKFKDAASSSELGSLKYTQKLIDLRLSYLQNNKPDKSEKDKHTPNLPILSLDELLNKEIALSYYLDYLSILNLQKYVIFYLTAQEWKLTSNRSMLDLQTNKTKTSREEILKMLRDKAQNIFNEYLVHTSSNCLNIDHGLVEALTIKLKEQTLIPEHTWFDSICKFVYEKLKNEEIFLTNFYQSSGYKKLLLELEFCGQNTENIDLESNNTQMDAGSDSNSGDLQYEDDVDDEDVTSTVAYKQSTLENNLIGTAFDLSMVPMFKASAVDGSLLDVAPFKHSRSHSDCTGIPQTVADIRVNPFHSPNDGKDADKKSESKNAMPPCDSEETVDKVDLSSLAKINAQIINTAINCEGQYAVYAIQVSVVEDNQQKCWHIYRRYSRFLELKKMLVKKYPKMSRIPFPAKKAFQNTQRSVLEHRMAVLNEFLKAICSHAEAVAEVFTIMREFVEPDTNDRKISSGTVIRTIETLVNPIKSGMRSIKNMPDTLVGGIAKIFLGRGPMKETSFLDVTPIHLEQSSEYPALTSALNLLDEVFDLQARSQWLRRGIINRLLGAPWVSHTANKKIIQAAKALIDVDKIEFLLSTILNNIWPEGKRSKGQVAREDNTKLRTRMASRIALFALLSDDLKHVLGSETTRHGLLNFFQMLQNRKLNLRLMLVLLNDVLTTLYQTESMIKHVTANQ